MSNVISLRNTGGFTRMDNELYEALIRADLSGRELRVALAIHRLTVGFNVEEARIAASVIADMSGIARENVSRIIGDLIRQRVLYRSGSSRAPIGISPSREWKIDVKSDTLDRPVKSTQSVKNDTSKVLKLTHNKDSKDNLVPSELVDASAPTMPNQIDDASEEQGEQPGQPSQAERIPFQKIVDLYNRVCGDHLPQCLRLNEKRKRNIRKCWNLQLNGSFPFRNSSFWEGYFNDCLTNRHWIGENDRGWRADLEFLTREEKVLKVLEGA